MSETCHRCKLEIAIDDEVIRSLDGSQVIHADESRCLGLTIRERNSLRTALAERESEIAQLRQALDKIVGVLWLEEQTK